MFKIDAEPRIPASLTIVGQARTQTLKLVYRHRSKGEYASLMERLAKGEIDLVDAVLDVVESWEADGPLDRVTLVRLQEQQPGADFAILNGFGEAIAVERRKN